GHARRRRPPGRRPHRPRGVAGPDRGQGGPAGSGGQAAGPRRAHRSTRRAEGDLVTEQTQGGGRRAAIVVNPTKFEDVRKVRDRVTRICHEEGWADPLWLETTPEDTGTGQTRQAVAEGVDLV